jgi:dihydrofolate synthase/folylpolyglutamate synthase
MQWMMPRWATIPRLMKTLTEWLAHCEQLHPKNIDMGLDRVRTVAKRMQLRFDCPVITVAGTNGKGSTCAMLESILGQAGYRTGVYTSPHLVHFQERLRLNGEAVSPDALVPGFAAVERARGEGDAEISLTYFEFSTLAIFDVMRRAGLDVVILEVGLGGRLDAVNIIDSDCAVITSIDLDHMARRLPACPARAGLRDGRGRRAARRLGARTGCERAVAGRLLDGFRDGRHHAAP